MDAKLFRLPTKPDFYAGIATANPFEVDARGAVSQLPAPDSRYPGYAAPMSDGRLVTDYRNHCSKNVPVGSQFSTKEWMTKNAIEIIRLSRERQAAASGATFGTDPSTVPPPAMIVECSAAECSRQVTENPGGIGMERAGAAAPGLFGTWEPTASTAKAPQPNIGITRTYEGGRNTPRGLNGPGPLY